MIATSLSHLPCHRWEALSQRKVLLGVGLVLIALFNASNDVLWVWGGSVGKVSSKEVEIHNITKQLHDGILLPFRERGCD